MKATLSRSGHPKKVRLFRLDAGRAELAESSWGESSLEQEGIQGGNVMKEATRATRRGHDQRMKNRARRTMRLWAGGRNAPVDPRQVGVNASTHCRPCACWMCQADAREVPPMRERAFDYLELS